jgi:hypothetical protein
MQSLHSSGSEDRSEKPFLGRKRKARMTSLATILADFGALLATHTADQATVATDAQAVTNAQAKEAADTTTAGVDQTALQAKWNEAVAAARALGLTDPPVA